MCYAVLHDDNDVASEVELSDIFVESLSTSVNQSRCETIYGSAKFENYF